LHPCNVYHGTEVRCINGQGAWFYYRVGEVLVFPEARDERCPGENNETILQVNGSSTYKFRKKRNEHQFNFNSEIEDTIDTAKIEACEGWQQDNKSQGKGGPEES